MKLFQLFGLLRARMSPKSLLQGCRCAARVLMALSSSLAALVTLVTFVLDIVLFSIARHEFHKLGWSSQYGNAMAHPQRTGRAYARILHLNSRHIRLV